MNRSKNYIAFVLLLAFASSARADALVAHDVTFTADCDGTEQKYTLILPANFDAGDVHDVMIALHGHGADRRQYAADPRDECRAARDVAAEYRMIFVAPDYRATTSWMGPNAEADVLQIIRMLKAQHKVQRVFLVGASMGGTSALTFAALHPELIAGVASQNAHANHLEFTNFQDAIANSFGGTKQQLPDEYKRRSAELNAEQLKMPVAIVVGGKDTVVPPHSAIRLGKELERFDRPVQLVVRDKDAHFTNYDDSKRSIEFVMAQAKSGP